MKTNRIAAILLLVTLGYFGVHSFYQKKTTAGVLYILAFTIGWLFLAIPPMIAAIFLLVEFYKLMMTTDADYAKMQEDAYEDTEKSGLTAGALGLTGGIFGLHFSYLGMMKAAKNRFLLFILPLPLLIGAYIFSSFSTGLYGGLTDDNMGANTAQNLTNIAGFFGFFMIIYVYYFVLLIISLVESYRYLQQKTIVSE